MLNIETSPSLSASPLNPPQSHNPPTSLWRRSPGDRFVITRGFDIDSGAPMMMAEKPQMERRQEIRRMAHIYE